MTGRKAFATAIFLSLLAVAVPAKAQSSLPEGIQIGLSTDNVSITAGFPAPT